MSNPVIVNLKTPLKRGEEEINQIELREPKSGELRGLELFSILRMDVTAQRTLVPRISNMTANEFDALSPSDLVKVMNEVCAFFME